MTRFRNALILAGAVLGALALLPSAPAVADTIGKHAHAGFRNDDDNVGMDVDVAKVDGRAVIDVEWQDSRCVQTDTAYVCDSVFRLAYGVPVRRFSFSLTGVTTVAAVLPYREIQRHCSFVEEQRDCTEQESTGTTSIELTWTARTPPTHYTWTDEQGVQQIVDQASASVTGTGFGLTWGGDSYGVLARTRTLD